MTETNDANIDINCNEYEMHALSYRDNYLSLIELLFNTTGEKKIKKTTRGIKFHLNPTRRVDVCYRVMDIPIENPFNNIKERRHFINGLRTVPPRRVIFRPKIVISVDKILVRGHR